MVHQHPLRNEQRGTDDHARIRPIPDGGRGSLGIQEALSLLSNPTARFVLLELRNADDAVDRRQLARRVVARRHDRSPSSVSSTAVDRALTDFHHLTLPSLRTSGLVSVDGQTIELVAEPRVLGELLDTIERVDPDSSAQ